MLDAKERLLEEMGFGCELYEAFSFIYKAEVGDLIEHEFDHVLIGQYDGEPKPNPEEADGWEWVSIGKIEREIEINPQSYTVWFKIALPKVLEYLDSKKQT